MIGMIAAGAGIVVVGLLGYAASRPSAFTITRSTKINAPPEKIFPHVNDFRNWSAWSPWEKLDPQLRRTHSGQPAGKGAVYEWEGNKKVGQGRMDIVDSTPPTRVEIRLEFIKPWKAVNTTTLLLSPQGHATDVTWSTNGTNPLMMKVMGVFMNMDELVGKDFEKGLAELKRISES